MKRKFSTDPQPSEVSFSEPTHQRIKYGRPKSEGSSEEKPAKVLVENTIVQE